MDKSMEYFFDALLMISISTESASNLLYSNGFVLHIVIFGKRMDVSLLISIEVDIG